MYLLLSPAKNLNETTPAPLTTQEMPALLSQSQIIATTLKTLNANDIADLMKVSNKIAKLNDARHQNWQVPFDDTAKPAIYLFDGDAYKGLDAYELHADEVEYLQAHLGILSGLYGLLCPLDNIMPYRLEMGTCLSVGKHGNLYDFWGDDITNLINKQMDKIGSHTLINLASQEYFKAVNGNKIRHRLITPKFMDAKGDGNYKVISFYAKRARGLMTRFCAVNQLTNPKDLQGFDMEGYYFDRKNSSDTQWVFLRDEPF